jgi:enoyl-CoA hydratase
MSTVLCRQVDRVATVILNRPKANNSISRALLTELTSTIKALDASEEVNAIILTGAGSSFCAGVDLKELSTLSRDEVAEIVLPKRGTRGPFASVSAPRRTPLISAINGACVTGGLELALAGDILIASENATFADTHARVGVMPSWGMSVLLPEKFGRGRALQMALSGDYINAVTACEWGLVNVVVPHEELLHRAERLAHSIAHTPATAVQAVHASYTAHAEAANGAAWDREHEVASSWVANHLDVDQLREKLTGLFARGRAQQSKS